jgi:hypothetical protein
MNLDWIEHEVAKRDARPIDVPMTAIVSGTDGVVHPPATVDRVNGHIPRNWSSCGSRQARTCWTTATISTEGASRDSRSSRRARVRYASNFGESNPFE